MSRRTQRLEISAAIKRGLKAAANKFHPHKRALSFRNVLASAEGRISARNCRDPSIPPANPISSAAQTRSAFRGRYGARKCHRVQKSPHKSGNRLNSNTQLGGIWVSQRSEER